MFSLASQRSKGCLSTPIPVISKGRSATGKHRLLGHWISWALIFDTYPGLGTGREGKALPVPITVTENATFPRSHFVAIDWSGHDHDHNHDSNPFSTTLNPFPNTNALTFFLARGNFVVGARGNPS